MKNVIEAALACAYVVMVSAPLFAQSILPQPDVSFKGKMGLRPSDSAKDFPKEVTAPKGAPNILLILTDDVGFGASSPFGGPIPTPTMERIANAGIRFNRFHTTALCSPTRAALPHRPQPPQCGATGGIMEIGVGYPGYNTLIPHPSAGSATSSNSMATTRPGLARTTMCPTGIPAKLVLRPLAHRTRVRVLLRAGRWRHPASGPRQSSKTRG